MTPDEQIARRLLWLRHGCSISMLYGDDGEMQCGRCIIDFKRNSMADIEARFQRINLEQMKAEQLARGTAVDKQQDSAGPTKGER